MVCDKDKSESLLNHNEISQGLPTYCTKQLLQKKADTGWRGKVSAEPREELIDFQAIENDGKESDEVFGGTEAAAHGYQVMSIVVQGCRFCLFVCFVMFCCLVVWLFVCHDLWIFRQSFSSGTFESFEETYEGLVTRDPENKKLILDQVSFALQMFFTLKKGNVFDPVLSPDFPGIPHKCAVADFHQGTRCSSLQEICHRVCNSGADQ